MLNEIQHETFVWEMFISIYKFILVNNEASRISFMLGKFEFFWFFHGLMILLI